VALTAGYNSYLTVENAMADYVNLIRKVKEDYSALDSPVFVFGGSYGGLLAAWLRMKYPAVFQGALATSAPLVYFKGSTTVDQFAFAN